MPSEPPSSDPSARSTPPPGAAAGLTRVGPREVRALATDPMTSEAWVAASVASGAPLRSDPLGAVEVGLEGLVAQALDEDTDAVPLPERYRDQGLLGAGGMGEVRRVFDRQLSRSVALKILHEDITSPELVARFLEEAQVTAQLAHPGILPVHDVGRLADGRLYFTMKEVHGRTLRRVIAEVHAASPADAWGTGPSGWTFRRLLAAFHQVCQAMSYAHARRVVHRDLKPANVMVGSFGQVLVLDWGLAKVLGAGDEAEPLELSEVMAADPEGLGTDPSLRASLAPVESERSDQYATRAGVVGGTILYMPPEQALGMVERLGPQADVYALGAMLYEILAGRPPYDVADPAALFQASLKGPGACPGRLEGQGEGRPIPEPLWELCQRCLMFAVGERPRDAGEVAAAVGEWLDGARRREAALAQVAVADELGPRVAAEREEAATLRHQAETLLASLSPLAPAEQKRPAWLLEDRARELEREAELHEIARLQALRAALSQDPELPEAHARLADHHRQEHQAAEARGDTRAAAQAEALLRAHDRGRHAAWLQGTARLSLETEPRGAFVTLHRYVERDRRLVDEPWRVLGFSPVREVELPHGSYLLVVRQEGFRELRVPVSMGRLEHWDGVPPGGEGTAPLRLLRLDEVGEHEVPVPAGWFWSGGDEEANSSLPRRRVWVDGFLVQRHPVTNAAYITFLDDLVAQGREAEALRFAPRERGKSAGEEGALVYGRTASGGFELVPDADGDLWQPDWPVFLVDWAAARAYADWWSVRTGQPWRLPSELEWEKAARGVDGRAYPWGHHREPAWCAVQDSHPGRMLPRSVEDHPFDLSPYGVRGLGGNARDWCRERFTDEGPRLERGRLVLGELDADDEKAVRVTRGGAWYANARDARCASRIRAGQRLRGGGVGFRLVRPWPA